MIPDPYGLSPGKHRHFTPSRDLDGGAAHQSGEVRVATSASPDSGRRSGAASACLRRARRLTAAVALSASTWCSP